VKQIIGFHFTLKDQSGEILGSSREGQGLPILALLGSGNVLPALERHLMDMNVGEQKDIIIPPDQAYGEVDPSLKLKLPRSKFPAGTDVKLGLVFQGGERDGWPVIFRVVKIEGDDIYVDANHESAGLTLHYDVVITEKREATVEEMAHGHAHHKGGSCHA